MARLSPQAAAQKWANNLGNSTSEIAAGIDRVTVSPTSQAAAKKDKMKQRLIAAIDSGKWEAGLRRVSLEDWKAAAKDKGVQRIGQGAQSAVNKQADFYSKLFPFQDTLQSKVKSMPDVTKQDSINRAVAWISGMMEFKR